MGGGFLVFYPGAGSHPLLELARLSARLSTPEVGLEAYRAAARGRPERAVAHFEHALFAMTVGHFSEARAALRRALEVPRSANPRKHDFRAGPLAAAHRLLAELYEGAGQRRKAQEQRKLGDAAQKRYLGPDLETSGRYSGDGLSDDELYPLALARLRAAPPPAVSPGQRDDPRGRRIDEEDSPSQPLELDPKIAFDITQDPDFEEEYDDT